MPGFAVSIKPERAVEVPLWRALRAAAVPATVNELHRVSRAHPNAIQLRLNRWERVGFVTVLPPEEARYVIAPRSADRTEAPTFGSLSAAAWAAMRRLHRPATFHEILTASGEADRPLYCRLRRWANSGHVIKIEKKPKRFALSTSAPDVVEPPRVTAEHEVKERGPTARDRIWRVMRILKRFDLPMLMITAEVNRRSAEDLLNLLGRCGYVRNLGRSENGWSTYAFIRNTGPLAPVISNSPGRDRRLLDRNNGQSMPIGPGLRRARELNHVR